MASTILTNTYLSGIALSDQYTTVASSGVFSVTNQDALFGATGTQWSVTNYGQVTDTGTIGTAIHLAGSGSVTNEANALLKGAQNGVLIGSNTTGTGTLTNYGTITQLGGTLFSAGVGFYEQGTVRNEGTIIEQSTTGAAVNLGTVGSTVINGRNGSTSGLITGYEDGVSASRTGTAPNTVINYGQIQSTETTTGSSTIFAFGVIATGTVENFGTIIGSAAGQNDVGVQMNNGGRVVNGSASATTALVKGGGEGVAFDAGNGSLVNYGTIIATVGEAVNAFSAANVGIVNSGLIEGLAENGINFGSGATGTVTNQGTITSNGTFDNAVFMGGGGSLTNGATNSTAALIDGLWVGVDFKTVTGTVHNFGTIESTATFSQPGTPSSITLVGVGVILQQGGLVVNGTAGSTAGVINGYALGVYLGGGGGVPNAGAIGTLVNYGTIESTGTNSVHAPAVELSSGGTVTNFGTISSAASDGVEFKASAGTLINHGTIESLSTGTSGDAVYMGGGGSVTNYGLITGGRPPVTASYTGVITTAVGAATIRNLGTVSSTNVSNGINLLHGGTILNGSASVADATITGKQSAIYAGGRSHTAYASGAAATITNYGTIQSTGTGSIIRLVDGGIVTNEAAGLIAGYNSDISAADASVTVINYGSITNTGSHGAVYLGAGGTVTNGSTANHTATIYSAIRTAFAAENAAATLVNFGTIQSTAPVTGTAGTGAYLQDGGAIINEASGVISADRAAVVLGGSIATSGIATVTNFGEITGSAGVIVKPLDAGANTIVNYGTITGTAGTAVALTGVSNTLVIEQGSVLSGAVTGFVAGDTIDFAGVVATSASYANGLLTLINGGSAVTSIGLTGLVISAAQLVATPDGKSGTDIEIVPVTVSSGQSFVISDGQAVGQTVVQSGGTLEVQSGGVADGAVVSGGSLVVSGGTAVGGTISAGGSEALQSGGSAVDGSIVGDSFQIVSSGAAASNTFVGDPSIQEVLAGGFTVSTVLSNGGGEALQGTASHTLVASGGTFTVLSGGAADGTVLSGGFLLVSSGASLTSSGVSGVVSGAGTVEFVDGGYVIAGTPGLTVSAGAGTAIVNALAGGDTVEGGAGSGVAIVFGATGDVVENNSGQAFVTLSGGTNPTIFALSAGAALLYAGADDTLIGGGGRAVAIGAIGDDFVLGSGNDTVNVISSGESLTFGSGSTIVFGGPGDTIGDSAGTVVTFTSGSQAIVLAGTGNSVLLYSGPGDTLVGGNAAATVIGSANDEIVLGAGADTVNAFPANEVVELGSGQNETIYGGAGDTIEAAGGSPIVTFVNGSQGIVFVESAGAEQLYSGPGDDLVIGGGTLAVIGAAGDTLVLGSGTDTVNALPPNETVTLGTGTATVFGGDGDTIGDAAGTVVTFTGGNSAISVEGTSGAVTVSDGAGDTIAAGNAAATIAGAKNSAIVMGAGPDTVTGANGDTVTTGAGSDSIDFGASHSAAEFLAPGSGSDGGATDTVADFNQSLGDRILETGTAETNTIASASTSGGNTTLTLSDGSTVTLLGVSSINTNFFS